MGICDSGTSVSTSSCVLGVEIGVERAVALEGGHDSALA